MQMTQIKGLLEDKHYEAMIPISGEVKTELRWWINQLVVSNGKSIIDSNSSMILTSDALDIAWGATWDTQSIGGCWSPYILSQVIHKIRIPLHTLRVLMKSTIILVKSRVYKIMNSVFFLQFVGVEKITIKHYLH